MPESNRQLRHHYQYSWPSIIIKNYCTFGAALAANLAFGRFNPGFAGQPGAHQEYLWSFPGMALVQGWNLAATSAGVPAGWEIAVVSGLGLHFATVCC